MKLTKPCITLPSEMNFFPSPENLFFQILTALTLNLVERDACHHIAGACHHHLKISLDLVASLWK